MPDVFPTMNANMPDFEMFKTDEITNLFREMLPSPFDKWVDKQKQEGNTPALLALFEILQNFDSSITPDSEEGIGGRYELHIGNQDNQVVEGLLLLLAEKKWRYITNRYNFQKGENVLVIESIGARH